MRFDKPLTRTREYVAIVRKALAREKVSFDGEFFTLPLPNGPGKALTLTVHPVREHIPIYLAAIGPKNLELTGEIADGWLAIFFAPENSAEIMAPLRAWAARSPGVRWTASTSSPPCRSSSATTLAACADPIRPYSALYIGGMGSRDKNFYNQLATRMGYEAAAIEIQEKYLARDYIGAAAAVPFEFIDRTSLIGPRDRVRDRLVAYAEAGVTTLTIAAYSGSLQERMDTLRTMV